MANAFAHIELSTDDLKTAKKFYKKIFDWKIEDMPNGYSMVGIKGAGKDAAGGGMQVKSMPEVATGWMPYVTVESIKKTMAKAAKAGATVVQPYHDIGEMGAIGVLVDPTGAVLGLWEAPKKVKKAAKKKAPAKKKTARKSR
jgi:predicted enzyme related to lactoylglutathione lyase